MASFEGTLELCILNSFLLSSTSFTEVYKLSYKGNIIKVSVCFVPISAALLNGLYLSLSVLVAMDRSF